MNISLKEYENQTNEFWRDYLKLNKLKFIQKYNNLSHKDKVDLKRHNKKWKRVSEEILKFGEENIKIEL